MSKPVERVEIITGIHRRRRHTAEEKVRLVEQTMQPGMKVSAVARLYGVAPSLLFQWRRRMSKGGGGISAEMIRDMMLDCVERRFNALRAPFPVQWPADNGPGYTAAETTDFAAALKATASAMPSSKP